jgi:hypothetical protein
MTHSGRTTPHHLRERSATTATRNNESACYSTHLLAAPPQAYAEYQAQVRRTIVKSR